MPNALRIGLLGPLQVRDEMGRPVHVGGRQLRVLHTLLVLNAGRVVADASLMPTVISGNTNMPTSVIGERIARSLLGLAQPRARGEG